MYTTDRPLNARLFRHLYVEVDSEPTAVLCRRILDTQNVTPLLSRFPGGYLTDVFWKFLSDSGFNLQGGGRNAFSVEGEVLSLQGICFCEMDDLSQKYVIISYIVGFPWRKR